MERGIVFGIAAGVALFVVGAGLIIWQILPSAGTQSDDDGSFDTGTSTEIASETVIELTFADYSQVHDPVATANAANCLMTPYSEPVPHAAQALPFFPYWMASGDVWLSSPGDFFEIVHGGSWYSGHTDVAWYSNSEEPGFTARFQHLDDQSLEFTVDETHLRNINPSFEIFISTIDIPAPGCWQVEASVGGVEGEFVINVLPFEERPDRHFAIDLRNAVTVFPPPPSCPVTPWTGPETRGDNGMLHWIDGEGISLADPYTVYWTGEGSATDQTHLEFYTDEDADFTVSGRTHDSVDQPFDLSLNFTLVSRVERFGTAWQALTTFPAPGCWDIQAEAGGSTFEATVYVFPEACRPNFDTLSHEIEAGGPITIPEGCQSSIGDAIPIAPHPIAAVISLRNY